MTPSASEMQLLPNADFMARLFGLVLRTRAPFARGLAHEFLFGTPWNRVMEETEAANSTFLTC